MGLLSRLPLVGVLVLGACASQTDAPAASRPFVPTPAAAESVPLPDGGAARAWGDGEYGVALVGEGWEEAGVPQELALERMRAVVAPAASPESLRATIEALHGEGVERVAVMAVGAGVEAALSLGASMPALVDQLIVVSGSGEVGELGEFPKLFVASASEPLAGEAERMADEAPGAWNAVLLTPHAGTGLEVLVDPASGELADGILRRLEERR